MKIIILVFLIIGLTLTVFLVDQKTGFLSRASIPTSPQNVKISNISDNSFTVSWTTLKPATGFIQYGKSEKLGKAVNDDRDIAPRERLTHHITLKDLDPEKQYFYKIGSGSEVYGNKGKPFVQTTAPVASGTPAVAEPVFGKLVGGDGLAPKEALVYLKVGNGSLLSSYSRGDGNWLVTLNNARTEDLVTHLQISGSDPLTLKVEDGVSKMPEVKTTVGDKSMIFKITLPRLR